MIKETLYVKMPEGYKDKALNILDETINKIVDKKNKTITESEKRKIKNLSLDQVNINISQRIKSKSMWVFDTETHIPVSVRSEEKLGGAENHSESNPEDKLFKMKNNLSWTYQTTNKNSEDKMNKDEFNETVLNLLLEDFETAAFYGTLSYVEE